MQNLFFNIDENGKGFLAGLLHLEDGPVTPLHNFVVIVAVGVNLGEALLEIYFLISQLNPFYLQVLNQQLHLGFLNVGDLDLLHLPRCPGLPLEDVVNLLLFMLIIVYPPRGVDLGKEAPDALLKGRHQDYLHYYFVHPLPVILPIYDIL